MGSSLRCPAVTEEATMRGGIAMKNQTAQEQYIFIASLKSKSNLVSDSKAKMPPIERTRTIISYISFKVLPSLIKQSQHSSSEAPVVLPSSIETVLFHCMSRIRTHRGWKDLVYRLSPVVEADVYSWLSVGADYP